MLRSISKPGLAYGRRCWGSASNEHDRGRIIVTFAAPPIWLWIAMFRIAHRLYARIRTLITKNCKYRIPFFRRTAP